MGSPRTVRGDHSDGRLIIQHIAKPGWTQVDVDPVRAHLDPLDQNDENEPGSQQRQRAPAGCELAGAGDQSLLFSRRLDLTLDQLEHALAR